MPIGAPTSLQLDLFLRDTTAYLWFVLNHGFLPAFGDS